ncbi:MFS transporter [Dictyobacter alpinus]|uniref:MFS transporter n=1 Tax=Dictyobacter alpinus TaxID=2014873 RepID=A0A402BJF7_9CHLR|nr:MFS transporter [Dictyobacter alpinus]GCE31463.1 MFS transporter [Dictyobacter alpinus]
MLHSGKKIAQRSFVLALLCMAQFMVVLDFSIVNVALPSMQNDLGMTTQNLQWIVSAYSLTFGGFLLLGGRAADLFGRRRLFLASLVVFSLASLAGGLARTGEWLIIARAIQGLGAAVVAPTSLALVTSLFAEGPERNRALGVMGAVASTAFAAGAILGGLLTAGPGWRWVMFVNVPVGLLACILTPFLIPNSQTQESRKSLDILGAVTVTAGIVLLVYALARGNEIGWLSWQILGFLALGVILLVSFVFIEAHTRDPLVRLDIFRMRTLTGANLIAFLLPGTFGAIIFVLTLFMQRVLHYDAIMTGLAFLPMAFILFLLSNVASSLVSRIGVRPILIASISVTACGEALFLVLSATSSYVSALLPGMLVVGLGMGFVFTAVTIAATTGIHNEEQGLASGLLNTSEQVGSSLVLAVVTAIATGQTAFLQAHGSKSADALALGFRSAIWVCLIFVTIGLCLAIFVVREKRQPEVLVSQPEASESATNIPTRIPEEDDVRL